jgi:hypothetical protein
MLAGDIGKGRAVYDGMILLSPQDDPAKPKTPEEAALMHNVLVWLAYREQR